MHHQKTEMSKKKFRIGELAKELKIKKYVIRFWEKEFALSSDRSEGGQRFYTQKDLDTFSHIKDLLYGQGFTISGAKKQLEDEKTGVKQKTTSALVLQEKTNVDSQNIIAARKEQQVSLDNSEKFDIFLKELKQLKRQLINFKSLLDT